MRLCCPKCCEGYSEDLSHCPKCGPINVGKTAASPWNFDMDAAPRDGTRVMLAWEWKGNLHVDFFFYREDDFRDWWDDDDNYLSVTPFAWAAINLPEVPK